MIEAHKKYRKLFQKAFLIAEEWQQLQFKSCDILSTIIKYSSSCPIIDKSVIHSQGVLFYNVLDSSSPSLNGNIVSTNYDSEQQKNVVGILEEVPESVTLLSGVFVKQLNLLVTELRTTQIKKFEELALQKALQIENEGNTYLQQNLKHMQDWFGRDASHASLISEFSQSLQDICQMFILEYFAKRDILLNYLTLEKCINRTADVTEMHSKQKERSLSLNDILKKLSKNQYINMEKISCMLEKAEEQVLLDHQAKHGKFT